MDAALLSEGVRAWSPAYCMASWRNTRNMFAVALYDPVLPPKDIVQGHGSPSRGADIGQFPAFGRNMRNRLLSFSHRRHTVVADQPCRARSDRGSVCLALTPKNLLCITPVLRASYNLVSLSSLQDCPALQSSTVPRRRTDLILDN
ncbi:hypothetical protein PoB_007236100 [Plakobranchus ocellatus]|uniref:Uncharacterized protein n=1 Tax=Plakobranchus ocellatus TaxID=259542 RepID=A0AAV4DPS9_9GAST|nr:hypothetical protein PoB_007236100 [Plakobranchus ocellatus]